YPPVEKHISFTWEAYFSGDHPFKEKKNRKDIPDAWIFAAAKDAIEDEGHKSIQNRFCICNDVTLRDALKGLDFDSIDGKDLLSKLQEEKNNAHKIKEPAIPLVESSVPEERSGILEVPKPDSLDYILSKAMNDDMRAVFIRLLGMTYWMSAPVKEDVISSIASLGFNLDLIKSYGVILSHEPFSLITDTGNHYIAKDKKICKEAGERIMPEIVKMLEKE
ncbi:MAG: hypothetical protein ABW189_03810, partial [Rickettsiales bacterium]